MVQGGANGTGLAIIARQCRSIFVFKLQYQLDFLTSIVLAFNIIGASARVWTIERNSNETNLEKSDRLFICIGLCHTARDWDGSRL
jgi:uncharacterized membrane protein YqjE